MGLNRLIAMTAGERIKRKQDVAANLAQLARVMEMRPKQWRPLTTSDIRIVGKRENIPPLHLQVLSEKESGSDGGFLDDGRLVILNEPHCFSRLTACAFDVPTVDPEGAPVPPLGYPRWVKLAEWNKLPAAWLHEWKKHPYNLDHRERWALLGLQAMYNFDAAVQSISMGRFQVMGFHWRRLGFASPLAMLEYAYEGEAAHLDLAIRFLRMEDKLDLLRRGDWRRLSVVYNGTGDPEKYADDCDKICRLRSRLFS